MRLKVSFDMLRVVEWMVIRIIDTGYRILRPIVHFLLTLAYWSRCQTVPPVQDPILKMSATELAKQILEGKVTSEAVIRTFADRILEVEPFINATVECRFGDALREAREVDALVAHSNAQDKERLAREKPLLGVPVTIKVLLTVKGMRCTAGSLLFQDLRAQEDAQTVALLKGAGAIVIATTNTAEMGMNFETNNFAHGTTCNPYDTSKTSGGSSGGESALLAAAGSVVGLGNDLAGSIRVPCMFSGIFGHKPSRGLVENGGCFPIVQEKLGRLLNTGPMCRYAKDLVTTMRILTQGKQTHVKFGEEVEFRSIKIYYMYSFGKMSIAEDPEPEIQDAIKKVVSYFEKKYGSITKQANIPLLKLSNGIYIHQLISSTPNIQENLTGGKVKIDAGLEILKMLFRQSNYTIGPLVAMNASHVPILYSYSKVERFKRLGEELMNQFSKLLDDSSILVLPTMPFAAPFHNEMPMLTCNTCYVSIFNTLGLPVTQCPVTLNKRGLPIGVQIVGRHGNDALTIACAIELEKAFGGWIPPK